MAEAVAAQPVLRRALPLLDRPVSLVGGAVRDALLGLPHPTDVDLVVEGDAGELARRLGRELGARVVEHGRFGTAVLELPHSGWIDLATARRERYPQPGALPEVEPGSLSDDLARRDFSINAIAYVLSGPDAGRLVDPCGGLEDLRARLVRALRVDSFVEDPSRLLRAVRYAARLGLRLAPETARGARDAADAIDIPSARVADELRRLLDEAAAVAAQGLGLAAALGVPWLSRSPSPSELAALFVAIDRALARPRAPAIDAWPLRLGVAVPPAWSGRAGLAGWAKGAAVEASEGPALARALADPALRPSQIDSVLRRSPAAAAVVALACGAEAVARWWADHRDLEPAVSGADLVAAGVRPGPAIGRALRAVRAALLDGARLSRDEQLALALGVADA